MTDADLLTEALRIATEAHRGQRDKLGQPYILHPLRVMLMGETNDERIVGLLHDVLEDCPDWSVEALSDTFPSHIVEAVEALTKRPGESYPEFIARTKSNPLAAKVKRHDIRDNMAPERMWLLDAETRERLQQKYGPAIAQLEAL